MAVQPIRPEHIPQIIQARMLDEVIAAFNELITRHLSSGYAGFLQKEVVALIIQKLQTNPEWQHLSADRIRSKLFADNLLDVEDVFRDAGWDVRYDKPGYNETYDAFFTFSIKRR